ncbi:A disintegrin and metalloproteinase with thrombospondin motifs like [Ornithodoros turicata]|uniref:A disintegrin and metalloproteinase with thrombospondin motifs like n=1 Tax=Ornithodoros turicata TaxID=34597 RepID=UPI0031397220
MIALITGRDLCTEKNKRISCSTSGMAYAGGACGFLKLSIGEDRPWSFNVVRTMAHEFAHNLGCVHDGEPPMQGFVGHPGAIACPWSWGYIMSYVQEDTREYYFSSCCAAQIRYFARHSLRTCLFKNNTYKEVKRSEELPGFITTLDTICNNTYGRAKFTYIYDKTRKFQGCRIPCKVEHAEADYYPAMAKAVDGTNCSSTGDMICIRGGCVPRNKATGIKLRRLAS